MDSRTHLFRKLLLPSQFLHWYSFCLRQGDDHAELTWVADQVTRPDIG